MPPGRGKLTCFLSAQNITKLLISLFNHAKTLSATHQLHAHVIAHGLQRAVLFGSRITNAYVELGFLQSASKAFNQITSKNLHSWNTIISGFSKNKHFNDVLVLYNNKRRDCGGVDSFNLVFAIKACIGLLLSQDGKSIHCLAIKSGLESDLYVAPALVEMYIELAGLEDAEKVFEGVPKRSSVLWGILMKGYLKFSKEFEVFDLFSQMKTTGFELDSFTLEGLVHACGNVSASKQGRAIHGFCIRGNFLNRSIYLQASLVDMYLKCGLLNFAFRSFVQVNVKDVVLWTSVIAGFSKNGRAQEAMSLFRQMLEEQVTPNSVTFSSVLLACSSLGSLKQGKSIHGYMIRNGVRMDTVNYTSFIDMYARCSCLAMAQRVFYEMPEKNAISWSAMINAYGMHGLCSEAFTCFDQMKLENQVPNSITFVSILSACSHSGKVQEGWRYFRSMSQDYRLTPGEEHYACMVDLLGRAGKIDEALSFIHTMPIQPDASAWGALLGACRIHKRIDLVEEVAKKLQPLESDQTGLYVLLSNIYADAGMWDSVKKVRKKLAKKGFHKNIGFTAIEVGNKYHLFSSAD